MKALQDRLDLTVQKLSTAEINTRNLTRERDAALAQLGVAFCSSEDLKRENQVLVGANEALKDDLTRLQAEVEDQKQQWARKESSLLKKMRQRDEAVRDVRDVTREIRELQKPVERERTRPRHGSQVNNTARIQEPTETRAGLRDRNQTSDVTRDATDAYKTVKADPPIQASHAGRKGLGKSYPVDAHSRRQGIAAHDSGAAKTAEDEGARAPKRTRTRTIVVEETIHSGLSDADGYVTDPRQKNNDTRREPETDETVGTQASDTGDITNLSFLDVSPPARDWREHAANAAVSYRRMFSCGCGRPSKPRGSSRKMVAVPRETQPMSRSPSRGNRLSRRLARLSSSIGRTRSAMVSRGNSASRTVRTQSGSAATLKHPKRYGDPPLKHTALRH